MNILYIPSTSHGHLAANTEDLDTLVLNRRKADLQNRYGIHLFSLDKGGLMYKTSGGLAALTGTENSQALNDAKQYFASLRLGRKKNCPFEEKRQSEYDYVVELSEIHQQDFLVSKLLPSIRGAFNLRREINMEYHVLRPVKPNEQSVYYQFDQLVEINPLNEVLFTEYAKRRGFLISAARSILS